MNGRNHGVGTGSNIALSFTFPWLSHRSTTVPFSLNTMQSTWWNEGEAQWNEGSVNSDRGTDHWESLRADQEPQSTAAKLTEWRMKF